jgi:hypothetical protein
MAGKSPPLRWQTLWLPKRGHAVEEYEDAHAGDGGSGRFAVADGAAESSFAGLWARLLVENFVRPATPVPENDWLAPLRESWARAVGGRELPWYAETKVQEGAFATFLGLVVEPGTGRGGKGRWRAVAVGDSCVFHTGGGRLRRAFPVRRARQFGDAPWLVGSRLTPGGRPVKEMRARGSWRGGDRLWLMTDALAHWFLRQHEARNRPWEALEALVEKPEPPAAFARWVEELRDRHELRNDDITIQIVCL